MARYVVVVPAQNGSVMSMELNGDSFIVEFRDDQDPRSFSGADLLNAPDDTRFVTIPLLGTHGVLEREED